MVADSHFWWTLAKLVSCLVGYAGFCWLMRQASVKAWVVVLSAAVAGLLVATANLIATVDRQEAAEAAHD